MSEKESIDIPEDFKNYALQYRFSKAEEEDLKKLYGKFEGNMNKIMENMTYSTEKDYDRFYQYLNERIDAGELKNYPAFTKETKKCVKNNHSCKELELEDLYQMIRKKNQKKFEALTERLINKYVESKDKLEDEPTEEEFQKARERLKQRRNQP